MASTYQLLLNGQGADPDLYAAISSLDVEESMDLPGAVQLTVPVGRTDSGDLTYVSDIRFQPMVNLAVVATPAAGTSAGSPAPSLGGAASALGIGGSAAPAAQCIFDGYILSHKLQLKTGNTDSTLAVWGQDASWLMNLQEVVKEWVDLTDADVANSIFGDYGIAPSSDNMADDSPSHTESGHTLMQRGSDIQFLRTLARRNGKVCRVACADQPGNRTGYFAKPDLSGAPSAVLTLNDPVAWTVSALDLTWDATLPTSVIARQALFTDSDEDGVSADTSDSGLPALGPRELADFTGQPMTVFVSAPVDSGGELALRAASLLRDSGWFVRCEGEADVARLGVVLRAGAIVSVQGIGPLHSGSYLVWSVRHTITADAHKMKFVLVRNAVGPAPSGSSGGLAGLVAQAAGAL
jgi:Phage tail baseplate hub (GPD)